MNSLLPGHQCYKISTGRFERCSGCSRLAILDSDVLIRIRHGHPIVHTVATGIVGVDETFDVADAMSFLREAEMLLILRRSSGEWDLRRPVNHCDWVLNQNGNYSHERTT